MFNSLLPFESNFQFILNHLKSWRDLDKYIRNHFSRNEALIRWNFIEKQLQKNAKSNERNQTKNSNLLSTVWGQKLPQTLAVSLSLSPSLSLSLSLSLFYSFSCFVFRPNILVSCIFNCTSMVSTFLAFLYGIKFFTSLSPTFSFSPSLSLSLFSLFFSPSLFSSKDASILNSLARLSMQQDTYAE